MSKDKKSQSSKSSGKLEATPQTEKKQQKKAKQDSKKKEEKKKDNNKAFLQELVSFMQTKGFVWGPEPEIYGGTAGFYTYAPLGKLLKNRVEEVIRKTLQKEEFYEVECPIVLEKKEWEASGHFMF